MTFVRWWTAAWALMGLSIALCLGVVCIQYFLYMDLEPRLRHDWPKLVLSTGLFLVIGVMAAAAYWTLHRQNRWRWAMQGLLLVTVLGLGRWFWQILSV